MSGHAHHRRGRRAAGRAVVRADGRCRKPAGRGAPLVEVLEEDMSSSSGGPRRRRWATTTSSKRLRRTVRNRRRRDRQEAGGHRDRSAASADAVHDFLDVADGGEAPASQRAGQAGAERIGRRGNTSVPVRALAVRGQSASPMPFRSCGSRWHVCSLSQAVTSTASSLLAAMPATGPALLPRGRSGPLLSEHSSRWRPRRAASGG